MEAKSVNAELQGKICLKLPCLLCIFEETSKSECLMPWKKVKERLNIYCKCITYEPFVLP